MKIRSLIWFALLVTIVSCSKKASEDEVWATATADSDGRTSSRETSELERDDTKPMFARLAEVDNRYPTEWLSPPQNVKLEKVVSISTDGLIKLQDGREVYMDGIKCSPEFISYLSDTLLEPDTNIYAIPSTLGSAQPIPARIWVVSPPLIPGKGIGSFQPVFENGITNGDCVPVLSNTSKFNDRYAALAKERSTRPGLAK